MEIRSVYQKRVRVQTILVGHSKTKQSHKDECDINKIIAKAVRAGGLPEAPEGLYGDFSAVPDYMTAIETINRAQEQFEALPAKLRKRLNNDPQEFLAFMADPENRAELEKLGMVHKKSTALDAQSNAQENKARVEASASAGQPAVGEGPAA